MRSVLRLVKRVVWIVAIAALVYVGAVVLLGLAYTAVTPVSTLMLGRWVTGRSVTRTPVSLDMVSPALPVAVIASEDGHFCRHRGIDWGALREVVESDEDGPSRGASTVPMQTAKNLFLWPGRSYLRKALELPIALWIDLVWSKRRMMENYLNIAEWGEGIFGIEAAARLYFRKAARDLSQREAALLAAALPNPILRNPGRPSPRHRALAGRLIARMETTQGHSGCLRR